MKSNRRTFLAGASSAGIALTQEHRMSSLPSSALVKSENMAFHRYDPALPARPEGNIVRIQMKAQEVPVCIRPGTVLAGWIFDGDIPGPIVHVRQGDTVEFTLANEGMMPHSMDFH